MSHVRIAWPELVSASDDKDSLSSLTTCNNKHHNWYMGPHSPVYSPLIFRIHHENIITSWKIGFRHVKLNCFSHELQNLIKTSHKENVKDPIITVKLRKYLLIILAKTMKRAFHENKNRVCACARDAWLW